MRDFGWKQVAWLLLLAGIVRLGAAVYWQRYWHGQFVFGDSRGYFDLANAIAHGQPYQLPTGEQVFRTPGYPLLLSPLLRLFQGPEAVWAARIEGCLFGSLTVVAVAWWAGQLFGPRAACIAGLITSAYPEAVAVSVPALSEASFCLLVAVNLATWTAVWKRWVVSDTRSVPHTFCIRALAAGLTAGAAALVRPTWMLFLPFALACGLVYPRRRKQLQLAAMTLAGFIVMLLPWWIRNYRVTGHFVPTTLQVGASLYDGWNPQATGASDMRFVSRFEEEQRMSDAKRAAGPGFEYRLDRRLRQAAWEWAIANPSRVAQLAAIKFLRFWNVWPNEQSFSIWPVRLAVAATYVPLLLAAAMGLWVPGPPYDRQAAFPLPCAGCRRFISRSCTWSLSARFATGSRPCWV